MSAPRTTPRARATPRVDLRQRECIVLLLPVSALRRDLVGRLHHLPSFARGGPHSRRDRKSTRLNSSHSQISYAVFCLKKKKKNKIETNIVLREIDITNDA